MTRRRVSLILTVTSAVAVGLFLRWLSLRPKVHVEPATRSLDLATRQAGRSSSRTVLTEATSDGTRPLARGTRILSLHVLSESGEPVRGARVFSERPPGLVGETNMEGVCLAAATNGRLKFLHPRFCPRIETVVDSGEAHQEREIRLSAGEAIDGTVVDQDGLPVEGVLVSVARNNPTRSAEHGEGWEVGSVNERDGDLAYTRRGVSDANGRFSMTGLTHGLHLLDVIRSGYFLDAAKDAMRISVPATGVRCAVSRAYAAAVTTQSDLGPAKLWLNMLSFPLTYPAGLSGPASMEEECVQWIKQTALSRLAGRDALVLCAKAKPMSGLGRSAALETTVPMTIEGRGTSDAALRFVPVDLFTSADALSLDMSGLEAGLVRVRVRAPLLVDLWSRGEAVLGAPYPPVAVVDEWQEFTVPKGDYFASPHAANLLGRDYGTTVSAAGTGLTVVDMSDKPLPGWLTVAPIDGTGRPTDQYSVALDNAVGNVLIDGALFGLTTRVATIAGDVHVRAFDRAGVLVEETTVHVAGGADIVRSLTIGSR